MKTILMLFFGFCFVFDMMAQKKIDLAELNIDRLNLYKRNATDLKNEGIALTIVGTGVAILGITIGNSENGSFYLIDEANLMLRKVFVSALGIISVGVGIPLWIIGGNRESAAEIILMKDDLGTNNSMAVKLGLSIRF